MAGSIELIIRSRDRDIQQRAQDQDAWEENRARANHSNGEPRGE